MSSDTPPTRKRFYKSATVSEVDGSQVGRTASEFRVLLDGRSVRTPAKRELTVLSRPLAEALAAEWDAQASIIDPMSMPLTRLVNSALDGVAGREPQVRAAILAYAGSDHLCYFADQPAELVERQSRRWAPIHAWAKSAHEIELALAVGVMPVAQPPDMIARVDRALGPAGPIELAAMHVMTALTGSLLLVLALRHRRISAEDAWTLAHVDEDYQIEKWGADAEAESRRGRRWIDMQAAARALQWCEQPASAGL